MRLPVNTTVDRSTGLRGASFTQYQNFPEISQERIFFNLMYDLPIKADPLLPKNFVI